MRAWISFQESMRFDSLADLVGLLPAYVSVRQQGSSPNSHAGVTTIAERVHHQEATLQGCESRSLD